MNMTCKASVKANATISYPNETKVKPLSLQLWYYTHSWLELSYQNHKNEIVVVNTSVSRAI